MPIEYKTKLLKMQMKIEVNFFKKSFNKEIFTQTPKIYIRCFKTF